MKITDKEAFADAQAMAKIAYNHNNKAFWWEAMRALREAYAPRAVA